MSSAVLVETLYDLLRRTPPDANAALQVVERGLKGGICAAERQRSLEILMVFLDTLETWLHENHDGLAAIRAFRQVLKEDPSLDEGVSGASFSPLLSLFEPLGGGDLPSERVPTDFSEKFLQAMNQLAKGHEQKQALLQTFSGTNSSVEELGRLLQEFSALKREASGPNLGNLVWKNALLQLHRGFHDLQKGSGRSLEETNMMAQKKRQKPLDMETLAEQVVHEVEMLLPEAGLVGDRLAQSRDKVERLRRKIDQLEADLVGSQEANFIDPKTGIANASGFSAHLKWQLERSQHIGEVFSLGLILLQNYATVCTPLSQEEVYRLWQGVAGVVRHTLGEGYFLARLTPNRLAILMPRMGAEESARGINEIGETLEQTDFLLEGCSITLSVHTGSVCYVPGMSVEELLGVIHGFALVGEEETPGRVESEGLDEVKDE